MLLYGSKNRLTNTGVVLGIQARQAFRSLRCSVHEIMACVPLRDDPRFRTFHAVSSRPIFDPRSRSVESRLWQSSLVRLIHALSQVYTANLYDVHKRNIRDYLSWRPTGYPFRTDPSLRI